MTSEAAYFPDALAARAEVREPDSCESEIPLALFEQTQSSIDLPDCSSEVTIDASEIADEKLLEQVGRDGSREALGLLFRRYARAVRNVAFRILRNEAEADDLVQDVFLFIFRKAALHDSARGKASTWILHVAYHRAFDRRRYLSSRHFYSSHDLDETSLHLADSREEIPFHEQSIEGILGKQLMTRFNAKLTPEQRETVQLYFFEGYSLKEIAEFTGRTLANVRSQYYRGLERLRKHVLPEKLRSK